MISVPQQNPTFLHIKSLLIVGDGKIFHVKSSEEMWAWFFAIVYHDASTVFPQKKMWGIQSM